MTNALTPVLTALTPVFLAILTGVYLRWRGVIPQENWKGIEALVYHVFFPAVVIMSLVKVNVWQLPFLGVGSALAGSILLMAMGLIAIKPWLKIENAAFTSVFQGVVRWNSFVGIALCGTLYGERGLAIASIAILTMIPLVNVLCVLVLGKYGTGKALNIITFLKTLILNPFIWSSIVGLILSLLQVKFPAFLTSYGNMLAQAALATGLMMVGAGLELASVVKMKKSVWGAVFLKLIISPLIVMMIGRFWGVSGVDLGAMMICASVPTASASYILAKQMGGDAPLMAEILTIQTICAAISLPLWLVFA